MDQGQVFKKKQNGWTLTILKPSGTQLEVRERLIIERKLEPRVGRTSLRKFGGTTSNGQEDKHIWDTVSVRVCRVIGENRDKRIVDSGLMDLRK